MGRSTADDLVEAIRDKRTKKPTQKPSKKDRALTYIKERLIPYAVLTGVVVLASRELFQLFQGFEKNDNIKYLVGLAMGAVLWLTISQLKKIIK